MYLGKYLQKNVRKCEKETPTRSFFVLKHTPINYSKENVLLVDQDSLCNFYLSLEIFNKIKIQEHI